MEIKKANYSILGYNPESKKFWVKNLNNGQKEWVSHLMLQTMMNNQSVEEIKIKKS